MVAIIFAGALCVFYFTAEWAQIRIPGEPVQAVTAYDFFLMGIARTDAAGNINGGAAFVWVILPFMATIIAMLTILSGLPSRLFVMMGSFGSIAAIGYVVALNILGRLSSGISQLECA